MSNQRQKYRQVLKGEETTLTQERIDALLSIGFKFNVRDAPIVPKTPDEVVSKKKISPEKQFRSPIDPWWDIRIKDLKKYKQKHGHCAVPPIYLSNRSVFS